MSTEIAPSQLGSNVFSQGVDHLRRQVLKGLKIDAVNDYSSIQDIARPEDAVPRPSFLDIQRISPESLFSHQDITNEEDLEIWWRLRWNEGNRNFADLEWHRLVVGWRITREIAISIGICHQDEMLSEALVRRAGDDPRDPWVCYAGRPPRVCQNPALSDLVGIRMAEFDVGLGIPDIAAEHLNEVGYVDPSYAPEDDQKLMEWLRLVGYIADRIGIEGGSLTIPDLGKLGLHGVFEPRLARLLWPSRYAIAAFEESLILETLEEMQGSGGSRTARKHLRDRYGVGPGECTALISAASQEAMRQNGTENAVQARAMLVLRLEEIMQRAKQSLDIRAELMTLRILAMVQGVTRTDPEDSSKAWLKAIDNVAKRGKPLTIEAKAV